MTREIIGQFDAERIKKIAAEVQRVSKARADYLADRKAMKVVVADKSLALHVDGHDALYSFRRRSLSQVLGTLDIPQVYADRLEARGHLDMLADDITKLMQREPKRHLLRTLDGGVDAFLSDRFKSFGNESLMFTALREVKAAGAQVWDMRYSPDEFRLLAVAPHIADKVLLDRTFEGADGFRARWEGKEGDVLNAAVTISNSETGGAKLNARLSILRLVCMNFCVHADGVARVHLGKRLEAEDDGKVIFSEETQKLDEKLVWSQIADVIKSAFNPEKFREIVAKLNKTTQRVIDKPTQAVDASIKAFALPAEYKEAILEELLGSGDRTQYGLANAINARANPTNGRNITDEVRSRLEDVAGEILEMDDAGFKTLLATPLGKRATVAAAAN